VQLRSRTKLVDAPAPPNATAPTTINYQQLLCRYTPTPDPPATGAIDLLSPADYDEKTPPRLKSLRSTPSTAWRLSNHVFKAELNAEPGVWGAAPTASAPTIATASEYSSTTSLQRRITPLPRRPSLLQIAGSSRFALPTNPDLAPPDPAGS